MIVEMVWMVEIVEIVWMVPVETTKSGIQLERY